MQRINRPGLRVLRFWLLLVSWVVVALRTRIAHLQILNPGTPQSDQPYPITDIAISHAFYGRLAAGSTDYYQFRLDQPQPVRLSLLIPLDLFASGFCPTLTISGSTFLPHDHVIPAGDHGQRRGQTTYQRTHRTILELPPGEYTIAIASQLKGVYCFCCGMHETDERADAATLRQIKALLAER